MANITAAMKSATKSSMSVNPRRANLADREVSRCARASRRLPIAASRRARRMRTRAGATREPLALTNSIAERQIRFRVAFRRATPIFALLAKTIPARTRLESLVGNQGVQDMLKRFGVELDMLTSASEIVP